MWKTNQNIMKKNQILKLTSIVITILQVIILIAFAYCLFIFIHWHFNAEAYSSTRLILPSRGIFTYSTNNYVDDSNIFWLSEMTFFSIWKLQIQLSSYLLVLLLIFKEIKSIINSVHHINTFRVGNINSFYKVAKYFIYLFFLSTYVSFDTTEGSFINFSIRVTPLLFALGSAVLAIIFEEGNNLFDDNKLTI